MREESEDGHMEDFARFGRITASLVPAILRLTKQSRKYAWRVIMGKEPDRDPGWDAMRGIECEKDAIAAFESETGLLARGGKFMPHPRHDWLGASPDGFVYEPINGVSVRIPLEAKCPRVQHTELPPMYHAQMQTQLECCEAPWGYFISWTEANANEPFILKVGRDSKWWTETEPVLFEFYMQYVKTGIEPPRSPSRRVKK